MKITLNHDTKNKLFTFKDKLDCHSSFKERHKKRYVKEVKGMYDRGGFIE